MKRLLASLIAVVALGGCGDGLFMAAALPDLYKQPYDFSVSIPPYDGDGGVGDLGASDMARADLAAANSHD